MLPPRMFRLPAVSALLALSCALRASADCGGELRALAGGYLRVDVNVEPALCDEVLAAARRLPVPHRRLLQTVTVVRLPRLPGLAPSSLAERLVSAATLAGYVRDSHVLVVTDAGAAGEARWTMGDAPALEVEVLLEGLGPALGLPDAARGDRAAIAARWSALVALVQPGGPTPPIGDASVLDRLIREGRRRLFGGHAGLAESLDHALAELVLHRGALERDDAVPVVSPATLLAFARISGWRSQTAIPDPTTPRWACEAEPLPFVAGLLGLDPGTVAGAAAAPGARFASPLGALSPRHDFCEAYRLAGSNPEKVPPEKLVAVNALGWAAGRNLIEPGPLRLDAESAPAVRARLVEGLRGILDADAEPALGAADAAALLRAHADLLDMQGPPFPEHPPAGRPRDLPREVSEALPPAAFDVRVRDRVLRPHPERVRGALVELAMEWEARGGGALPASVAAADRAARAGRSDAPRLLVEARRAARALSGYERDAAYGALAGSYARIGLAGEAMALVREITGEVLGGRRRAFALVAIAAACVRDGEWGPVAGILSSAQAASESAGKPAWRGRLAAVMAEVHAEAGQYEQAIRLLDKLDAIEGSAAAKAMALAETAAMLAADGHRARAAEVLHEARQAAARVPALHRDARFAGLMARAHVRIGTSDAAREMAGSLPLRAASRVRAVIGWTPGPKDRARPIELVLARAEQARDAFGAGRDDAALAHLSDGAAAARGIRDPGDMAAALDALARAYAAGDREEEAIRTAAGIRRAFLPGPDVRAEIALARARRRQWTAALDLAQTLSDDERIRTVQAIHLLRSREPM